MYLGVSPIAVWIANSVHLISAMICSVDIVVSAGCDHVCTTISCPSSLIRWRISGFWKTREPTTANVTLVLVLFRKSRSAGVKVDGPSSKLKPQSRYQLRNVIKNSNSVLNLVS